MRFGPILKRSFYERPTIEVARGLLGKVLVHGEAAGIVVETEAYLGGDDLASHSARGVTNRTRVIFGPPGHAYVYLIYGMYECLNIVAEPAGQPGCVLVRALEPVAGIEIMRQRRPAARRIGRPGLRARQTDARLGDHARAQRRGPDARPAGGPRARRRSGPFEIAVTPRIGITQCADLPLRFVIVTRRHS